MADESADLVTAGVIGIITSLVMGLGGGFAPYFVGSWLQKAQGGEVHLHRINALAGGILAGAGFTHLLGDFVGAVVEVDQVEQPTPYLFMLMGFLIPFMLENLDSAVLFSSVASEEQLQLPISAPNTRGAISSHSHSVRGVELPDTHYGTVNSHTHADSAYIGDSATLAGPGQLRTAATSGGELASTPILSPSPHQQGTTAVAWLLVLALAVHSFFEGVGIGVQRHLLASVGVLLAVLAHKGFAAFALGMRFRSTGANVWQAARGIVFFGIMTPIGITLGMVLRSSIESPWLDVVVIGISTGTFMYVGAVEILAHECADEQGAHSHSPDAPPTPAAVRRERWMRFLCFVIGIAIFVGLGYIMASQGAG
jgi:zinc transporter ZupT